MQFEWIHESPPRWDPDKARIVGGAPAGIFRTPDYREGDLLPGDWWRVEDGGVVAGYGWMDATWGEAEVLVAVAPDHQGRGVGALVLDRLEQEARVRGLNYLYNVVRPSHPDRARVAGWLARRGFCTSHDDDRLIRRVRTSSTE